MLSSENRTWRLESGPVCSTSLSSTSAPRDKRTDAPEPIAVALEPVADAATVAAAPGAGAPGAADVAAGEGGESDGGVAGPPPYIQVPVDCTVPGLSVIPEAVTWCPSLSVSRTVNGPVPAPEEAIQ